MVGKLEVMFKSKTLGEYNLLAYEDIKRLNIFSRLFRSLNYLIWGDV